MPQFINCPYCSTSTLHPYAVRVRPEFPHHMRVICGSCGLVFANPQATLTELEHFYQNYYDRGNFSDWKQETIKWKQAYQSGRISDKRALSVLQYELMVGPTGRRWLDIGAGLGKISFIAQHKGFKVTITDMDHDALSFSQNVMGLEQVYFGDLTTLSLPTEYYDVIVLNHVLEHVTDLFAILASIRLLLRPSGKLYVGVPNLQNWGYRLYRTSSFIRGRIPGIVDGMEHTFGFTPATLQCCLTKAGFKVNSLRTLRKGETAGSLLATVHKRGMKKAMVALAETAFHTRMECIALRKQ